MNKLRISAISFLNTAPLMWNWEHGEDEDKDQLRQEFTVDYTLPSTCAKNLQEGVADIGIIPVAAYTTIPNLLIIPDIAIAAKNEVRSILLVSTVPIGKIKNIAMDSSSRTSVALTRVLFDRLYQHRPGFSSMAPDIDSMLQRCDAALLIGDCALKIDRQKYITRDLAEDWRQLTGVPFVFAFWAMRKDSVEKEQFHRIAGIFRRSRDSGLRNVAAIADTWAGKLDLPRDVIVDYLTRNICYDLDDENIKGMKLFFHYAKECGALPTAPDLQFAR